MRVTYHQRHPGPERFSLERVFSDIRNSLPRDIEKRVVFCRYESEGILRRALNILDARRERADVHHIVGDIHYLALGLNSKNTVLTIHDCVGLHRLTGVRRFLLWAFWYYLPMRRARVVTAISAFTKNELVREVSCDPGRVRVIYNPISAAFAHVPPRILGNVPIILQVGTGPTKNVCRVIEALDGIRCRFWIVGNLNADQQRLLGSSRIEYRNFVQISDDELVSLYGQSDIVILASTYEGFGLPVIEAQAVGRPVIASNAASLPEVAGEAAEFVDPFDARGIREAVEKLIADAALRERLVGLGRENVKRFEPRRIAEQYVSVYREIESQRGS